MAQVLCEISNGLRPSEATVAVGDVSGNRPFLRVDRDFLTRDGDCYYLPVGAVYDDRTRPHLLIELPHEADSGANRLWVRRERLRQPSKAPA
jgi:hypothetical protein